MYSGTNIFDRLPTPGAICDDQGCVQVWNRAASKLTRIKSSEALGKNIDDLILELNDGNGFHFSFIPEPLLGEGEELRQYISIQRESLQRDFQNLRGKESLIRWEYAESNGLLALWDWDLERDQAYYSPTWKSMLGYSCSELPDSISTLERLLHPGDKEATFSKLHAFLNGEISVFEMVFRLEHKDGHYMWISSCAKARVRNKQNIPLRIIGTHQSVNDLTENREKFRQLFNHSPNLIFITNYYNNDVIEINQTFFDTFDQSFSEISQEISENRLFYIEPNVLAKSRNTLRSESLVSGIKTRFVDKSGNLHYGVLSIRLVRIAGQKFLINTISDSTLAVLAEEKAKKISDDFEAVFKNSPDAICLLEVRKSGIFFKRANPAMIAILKSSLDSVNQYEIREFISKKEHQFLNEKMRHVCKSGESINFTAPFYTQGQKRIYDTRLSLITHHEDYCEILGIIRDRTELEKNITERAKTNQVLTQLIHGSPNMVCMLDSQNHWLLANHAAQKVLGLEGNSSYLGKTSREIQKISTYPELLDQVFNTEIHAEKTIVRREVQLVKNQQPQYFEVTYIGIPDLENPINKSGLAVIINDTTRQRNYENLLWQAKGEAEAASQAKSDFLAIMSHEIRTPLNGIVGLVHLLQETTLTHEQLDHIVNIDQCITNLSELIGDILDFSKIESGKMDLEKIPFNPWQLIEQCRISVRNQIENNQNILHLKVDNQLPRELVGDPTRIRQVIINLLSNAAKFTQNGTITLSLKVIQYTAAYIRLKIDVQDTGIGIPVDRQSQIFESFTQADQSTNRKYGGTGLGLAISKRIVEAMDGTIDLISTPNEGSKFFFEVSLLNTQNSFSMQVTPLDLDENEVEQIQSWTTYGVSINQEYSSTGSVVICSPDYARQNNSTLNQIEENQGICLIWYNDVDESVPKDLSAWAAFRPPHTPGNLEKIIQNIPIGQKQVEMLHGSILIVDDNRINRIVLEKILNKYTHLIVKTAASGEEAIQTVSEHDFDIIFMDIQMPEMDGFEATQRIRNLELGKQPYIIALTAASFGNQEKLQKKGLDYYMPKPINTKNLISILKDRLN